MAPRKKKGKKKKNAAKVEVKEPGLPNNLGPAVQQNMISLLDNHLISQSNFLKRQFEKDLTMFQGQYDKDLEMMKDKLSESANALNNSEKNKKYLVYELTQIDEQLQQELQLIKHVIETKGTFKDAKKSKEVENRKYLKSTIPGREVQMLREETHTRKKLAKMKKFDHASTKILSLKLDDYRWDMIQNVFHLLIENSHVPVEMKQELEECLKVHQSVQNGDITGEGQLKVANELLYKTITTLKKKDYYKDYVQYDMKKNMNEICHVLKYGLGHKKYMYTYRGLDESSLNFFQRYDLEQKNFMPLNKYDTLPKLAFKTKCDFKRKPRGKRRHINNIDPNFGDDSSSGDDEDEESEEEDDESDE